MAIQNTKELDLKQIQRHMNISQRYINNSAVQESVLREVYQDFQHSLPTLENLKVEILSILNKELSGKVHSIGCRIKNRDHLIEKIIRNINCRPDKYTDLNVQNYNKIVTDLIGIRIIILDKRDWCEIHKSLLKIFRNLPERYAEQPGDIVINYDKYEKEANVEENALQNSYHAERPVVYITSEDDRELYQDKDLKVDNSKTHYRSIHYIIRYKIVYFEIQVRTLFEEGWLEFDHRIKYPYDQNNKKKQEYVRILSSLAVTADNLISFYNETDFKQEVCQDTEAADGKSREEMVENNDRMTLEDKMTSAF